MERDRHDERREEDDFPAPRLGPCRRADSSGGGKTLSAVVQDALRDARAVRLRKELEALQGYWSRRAKELGVLTEEDLRRYLRA